MDDSGEVGPTVSVALSVQSELELVFAGVSGFAAGVAVVAPESVDFVAPFDDEESDEESDDVEEAEDGSVEELVDEDFDFPPRLSVL